MAKLFLLYVFFPRFSVRKIGNKNDNYTFPCTSLLHIRLYLRSIFTFKIFKNVYTY